MRHCRDGGGGASQRQPRPAVRAARRRRVRSLRRRRCLRRRGCGRARAHAARRSGRRGRRAALQRCGECGAARARAAPHRARSTRGSTPRARCAQLPAFARKQMRGAAALFQKKNDNETVHRASERLLAH
jgi:hypothetical protein